MFFDPYWSWGWNPYWNWGWNPYWNWGPSWNWGWSNADFFGGFLLGGLLF